VMFGQAHDTRRRFDTDHDGHDIIFTIDDVYMSDPVEVWKVWEHLKQWVDGWNKRIDLSEIPEDTGMLEDESNE
jgi:hypothetical protein